MDVFQRRVARYGRGFHKQCPDWPAAWLARPAANSVGAGDCHYDCDISLLRSLLRFTAEADFSHVKANGCLFVPQMTPNHALQRTPGFGVQLPRAALVRPAQSRAVRPAMKPGTARAFALRRRAHSRAPGPQSLSLGSLGVARAIQ